MKYIATIFKKILEILKIGRRDVFQHLVTLIAHHSGQLVNYNQLATDCKISNTLIRNYLDILEQTYVIAKVLPFVGNKRTEITSNLIYYFIDNGFRNIALRNFSSLSSRTDKGLLVDSFVFQELFKLRAQHYLSFDIHYWRTKSGAEVDFILYKNNTQFIPIEVKYRKMERTIVSRSLRSFIEAYEPANIIVVTNEFIGKTIINKSTVYFMPLQQLNEIFNLIKNVIQFST